MDLSIVLSLTVLNWLLTLHFCVSFVINYNLTKMFTVNNNNSYFGYSLFIQEGTPPLILVGAPNSTQRNKSTGAVYKCDVDTLQCTEYNIQPKGTGVYIPDKNGDFLGASLDGDKIAGGKFFTCAPRFKIIYDSTNYFANGRCFMIMNSYDTVKPADVFIPLKHLKQIGSFFNRQSFYDAAFAETGFDIKYYEEEEELLLGDPGKASWSGALTRLNLNGYTSNTLSWKPDITKHQDNYFGYSISYGKFIGDPEVIWYVAGTPRGNNLNGQVIFFKRSFKIEGITVTAELLGAEFGSYFGASLLVVHNDKNNDDLLVGAPMYSGNSWDQGCVYYYKNNDNGTFQRPLKLLGKQPGSRFGQVIQDLGDLDLDSYSDIAVSAPYEDDGVGAVYIFYGIDEGFSSLNYHRITPSNFEGMFSSPIIKGFGLGISNGNDLDNNGHNDFAIGAYKSGQVFYFRTRDVIEIKCNVSTSVTALFTTTKEFSIEYCIRYVQRNKRSTTNVIEAELIIDSNRVLNERNVSSYLHLENDKIECRNHTVSLKKDVFNTDPLYIVLRAKIANTVNSYEQEETTVTIPVTYDCGNDNICETDLKVKAIADNKNSIICGHDRDVNVSVSIENLGETAYITEVYLTLSPEVNLINLRECIFENGNYACLIEEELKASMVKTFYLDVENLTPDTKRLKINITAKSFGFEVNQKDNELLLEIPVVLKNSPFIYSESSPAVFFWNKSKDSVQIEHSFKIGNQGPSPVKIDFTILVPNQEAFQIEAVEGNLNGKIVECVVKKKDKHLIITESPQSMNCTEDSCSQVDCRGGYFFKSSETASFTLKILAHIEVLTKFLKDIDSFAFTTTGYLKNETHIIKSSCSTWIYGLSKASAIPLWIYVSSAISGLVLLLLLIFILYKCNFFNRTYKHKLENEQGLIELNSDEENTYEM